MSDVDRGLPAALDHIGQVCRQHCAAVKAVLGAAIDGHHFVLSREQHIIDYRNDAAVHRL